MFFFFGGGARRRRAPCINKKETSSMTMKLMLTAEKLRMKENRRIED